VGPGSRTKGLGSRIDHFDKILVATGSFVSPKKPTLHGIDLFRGPILHAIDYHQPSRFKGQNVLLIGLHATAQDIAMSLCEHASKVYISHRTGLIMVRIAAILVPCQAPF
jgi:dimethylaniline monooxygenase (N-oxide forming)